MSTRNLHIDRLLLDSNHQYDYVRTCILLVPPSYNSKDTRRTNSEKIRSGILKYARRGWHVQGYKSDHGCGRNCPVRAHRSIGDRYTRVINLIPTKEKPTRSKDSNRKIELSTFGHIYNARYEAGGDNEVIPHWLPDFPELNDVGMYPAHRSGARLSVMMDVFEHRLLRQQYGIDSLNKEWHNLLVFWLLFDDREITMKDLQRKAAELEGKQIEDDESDPLDASDITELLADPDLAPSLTPPFDSQVAGLYNMWHRLFITEATSQEAANGERMPV